MSNSYYQSQVGTGIKQNSSTLARSSLNVGGFGALVGGASAAAQVIPQVRNNQISSQQAARDVLREAAGTGLAAAAGAAVVRAVGMGGGILSLVVMFGVAAGAKYLWNTAVPGGASAAAAPQAEPAPAAKTAKAAKTRKSAK